MIRPWLKSVLVIAVLSIWSAATVHCGIEASGVFTGATEQSSSAGEEDHGCCDPTEDCSRDNCGLVEDANYAQPLGTLKAPAPALSLELCLACLHAARAEQPALAQPAPIFASDRHPPTWLPDRHTARRAALPARAPTA